MTNLPSQSTPFDAMIIKSQKRRYHKYDAVYLAIEKIVSPHAELRSFWRSLDRKARATAAAFITGGTASTAFAGFEAVTIAHVRDRMGIAAITPQMEADNVD